MRSMKRYGYDCSLNGVSLLSLSENLFIQGIEEEPNIKTDVSNKPSNKLSNYSGFCRESLTISINFMTKDTNRSILSLLHSHICSWAKEGWLTTNMRDNQRIYAVCTSQPRRSYARDFDDMSIEFTAYDECYWQEIIPKSVEVSGKNTTAVIKPNGTKECFLEADITNTSNEAVNEISLSANGYTIAFSNLALASGDTLKIYYNERHILLATVNGVGKLSKRMRSSDDDIYLKNNMNNTVTFTADKACAVTLYARGLFE